jgi:hypothetical protein
MRGLHTFTPTRYSQRAGNISLELTVDGSFRFESSQAIVKYCYPRRRRQPLYKYILLDVHISLSLSTMSVPQEVILSTSSLSAYPFKPTASSSTGTTNTNPQSTTPSSITLHDLQSSTQIHSFKPSNSLSGNVGVVPSRQGQGGGVFVSQENKALLCFWAWRKVREGFLMTVCRVILLTGSSQLLSLFPSSPSRSASSRSLLSILPRLGSNAGPNPIPYPPPRKTLLLQHQPQRIMGSRRQRDRSFVFMGGESFWSCALGANEGEIKVDLLIRWVGLGGNVAGIARSRG